MNELKFAWRGDPEDMEGLATFTLPAALFALYRERGSRSADMKKAPLVQRKRQAGQLVRARCGFESCTAHHL